MAKVVSFRISQSLRAAAFEADCEKDRPDEAVIAAAHQRAELGRTIRKPMDAGIEVEPGLLTCLTSGTEGVSVCYARNAVAVARLLAEFAPAGDTAGLVAYAKRLERQILPASQRGINANVSNPHSTTSIPTATFVPGGTNRATIAHCGTGRRPHETLYTANRGPAQWVTSAVTTIR